MVSGPRSARDLLCRLRFGSAPPNLRPLATFSRPGSVDHQRTPRATLADTLSGNFLTSCNLSSCQLSIPPVRSGILPSQTCYRFNLPFCKDRSGFLPSQPLQALTIFASFQASICTIPLCLLGLRVWDGAIWPTLGSCASSHPKTVCALFII